MRILLLADSVAGGKRARLDKALNRIKTDYKDYTAVTWDYEWLDFSNLTWELYLPDSLGISKTIIKKETKRVWDRDPYKYDHVIFLVDPKHWQNGADKIGGWNLGHTYNKLYTQIVKISDNDEWLYKIFAMEIAHAIDNLALEENGDNLDSITELDFDNDIIHGENAKYGVPNNTSRTGYFTNYDYKNVIIEFGAYLTKAYQKREKFYLEKLTQKLTLLKTLLELLRRLQGRRAGPSPVTEEELDGHAHVH